jgi:hypothetical protein
MSATFILTIYEIDEYGLQVHGQQVASDEATLKATVVRWMMQHYPEHFEDGMFHDAPFSSIDDNFQAIILWSEYSQNAGGLRFLIRPADL